MLVLEGGTATDREAAALYYAAALSCAETGACGACDCCIQVRDKVYMDLLFLDGSEQSIKVDDIREVRSKVGEPPRGPGHRVVVLTEAQGLTQGRGQRPAQIHGRAQAGQLLRAPGPPAGAPSAHPGLALLGP